MKKKCIILLLSYRKIPKISLGLTFFKGPFWGAYFWRGWYSERLIFGGAYLWRESWISKSIVQLYSWKEIYPFCSVLLCIWGQFQSTSPPGGGGERWGGSYLEGQFNRGFFALQVSGLVFGGAYFWNFMVVFIIYFVFLMMNLLFFMIYHGIIFVIDTGHHKIDFLSFSSHLLVHCICHHQWFYWTTIQTLQKQMEVSVNSCIFSLVLLHWHCFALQFLPMDMIDLDCTCNL